MTTTNTTSIITVDGPSGSGKGTLCARLANKLGYHVLDSGALYRILGLAAQRKGMLSGALDEAALAALAISLDIRFDFDVAGNKTIIVNGEDVTNHIRTETVGGYASQVASLPKVRSALFELQRSFAKSPGLIADGRDMGTVVFPEADLKLFLTASSTERAKRRVAQLEQMGKTADYASILADIQARDARDTGRAVAPLKPADDAIVLDSSQLNIDQVTEKALVACQQAGLG